MQLPKSGRIVLIDDTLEEAKPLISEFTRNAIPHLYYDGRNEGLPTIPQEGIRFVFLDIELQGMEAQNDKTKASALVACLQKLISVSNGPYVIIFWTKHFDVIDRVIEYCASANIAPVAWADLEKLQCKDADGKYDINKISSKLKEKLESIGAFRLYVEWENILHMASNEFIREFSELIPSGDKWSSQTSQVFFKLYKAYVDEYEISDPTERFKCACWLMNRSFLDTLQDHSAAKLKLPEKFVLEEGAVDITIVSKLNSYLFLNSSILSRPLSGYVYRENSAEIKDSLCDSLFLAGQTPPQSELCKVIITPECDLARNKVLKHSSAGDKKIIHRVVYGVFFPMVADLKRKRNRNEAQFDIGPIWYEEKSWYMILHFATLSFQHEGSLKDGLMFHLRRDILFDLQSKSANHVNRLGNFLLK